MAAPVCGGSRAHKLCEVSWGLGIRWIWIKILEDICCSKCGARLFAEVEYLYPCAYQIFYTQTIKTQYSFFFGWYTHSCIVTIQKIIKRNYSLHKQCCELLCLTKSIYKWKLKEGRYNKVEQDRSKITFLSINSLLPDLYYRKDIPPSWKRKKKNWSLPKTPQNNQIWLHFTVLVNYVILPF